MVTIIKHTAFLILILLPLIGFSQEIEFLEAPKDFQLFARDKSDSATVLIKGKYTSNKQYDAIELKVFKDDLLFSRQESTVQEGNFELKSRIDAGLHQFRFELHFTKGKKQSLEIIADSVVCGDAYIVTGQSNSHASSSLSTYSSPYCRSFGVKTGYEAYSEDDKNIHWGRAFTATVDSIN